MNPPRTLLPLLAALSLPLLAFPQSPTDKPPPEFPPDEVFDSIRLLANSIELIRQDYIDPSRTNYKRLIHSALRGMLAELDPHSQFLDEEAFRSLQEDAKGQYGGIGIQLGIRDGSLVIISPIEGLPAFDAGLMPGDRILKINGQTTDRLSLPDAIDLLRGEVGQKVRLTIQRPSTNQTFDISLQRVLIRTPTIRDATLIPPSLTGNQKIAHIRLLQFSENTATELADALSQLQNQGAQALILDLRYNPGGLLSSAIDVCSLFLPPQTEVVLTASRSESQPYSTSPAPLQSNLPLVLLINSASASGAEIVAGALKDLHRALLIGETTFGKGSVQTVSAMGDGTALRITTAHYLTPSRQTIHEHGVKPHIIATLSPKQEKDLLRLRSKNQSPTTLEQWKTLLSLDPPLYRAIEILRALLLLKQKKHPLQSNLDLPTPSISS